MLTGGHPPIISFASSLTNSNTNINTWIYINVNLGNLNHLIHARSIFLSDDHNQTLLVLHLLTVEVGPG